MANEKVLVIEDDFDLSGIMNDYLKKEGFQIKRTFNGQDGIDLAKNWNPALIVLDIMLPKVDGIEVCRRIRQNSFAPIIIVSAKSSDADKLVSLGVGADDYLTKPFSFSEFIARVKSHIRRFTTFAPQSRCKPEEKRIFGSLVIDPEGYSVTIDGANIPLTAREFKLLDCLSAHPSQVFSKEQLLQNVWDSSEFVDDNTVAVYVGRLREKMSKAGVSCIKTVWGVGYKWEI